MLSFDPLTAWNESCMILTLYSPLHRIELSLRISCLARGYVSQHLPHLDVAM